MISHPKNHESYRLLCRHGFLQQDPPAYVLIELKTAKLTPEAAGQLNMYLNYYAAEVSTNKKIQIACRDRRISEKPSAGTSFYVSSRLFFTFFPDFPKCRPGLRGRGDAYFRPMNFAALL